MAGNHGRGRPPRADAEGSDSAALGCSETEKEDSEAQIARSRLRERWELASVLNFLHVFEPLMKSELKLSAEEIEEALIKPNDDLQRIHAAILKGIPPVQKNLLEGDLWVSLVCKKLLTWWPWVAEGDNPLEPHRGEEIERYKELDPSLRLLLLKALCEVRAEQDDILRYITDSLKSGIDVSTFRKERIGGDGNKVAYWYDGDGVIGHRLYRETMKYDVKQKLTAKGCKYPQVDSQWETLATNLDEFLQISVSLTSSKIKGESFIGETIRTELVPVVEKFEKKRERALKRRNREGLLLANRHLSDSIELRCGRRERGPVKYTFDDFDRRIDEAIELSKKGLPGRPSKKENKTIDHISANDSSTDGSQGNGSSPHEAANKIGEQQTHSDEDTDDSDYGEDNSSEKYEDGNDNDDKDEVSNDDDEKDEDGNSIDEKNEDSNDDESYGDTTEPETGEDRKKIGRAGANEPAIRLRPRAAQSNASKRTRKGSAGSDADDEDYDGGSSDDMVEGNAGRAGGRNELVVRLRENAHSGAKKRLRQRPIRNYAECGNARHVSEEEEITVEDSSDGE